jgi:hypothetical protein
MTISTRILVAATASCVAIAMPIGVAAQTDLPVLGTIGLNDTSGNLTAIQKVAHGQPLGPSSQLSVHDTVERMISDFDGDKLDDFIIRNGSGIGIVGNDTNDTFVLKAWAFYGTDIGRGWFLSSDDELVAVGRFAGDDRPGQLVLKRKNAPNNPETPLFAFVAAEAGKLLAKTLVAIGDPIMDKGERVSWVVAPGDKVIGVGRLNGKTDCLVVTSGWGMGIWTPKWSGTPDLLFIAPNETEFGDPDGLHSRTWTLNTTHPSFRLLGVGNIDNDQKAEMILASPEGFAVLSKHGSESDVWGSAALALRFHLNQGEAFPGTTIVGTDVEPPFPPDGTKDRLVSMMDFDKSGGVDLLFQRVRHEIGGIPNEGGVTVLRKSAAPAWSFEVISRDYGSYIGGWAFGQGDLLPPLAGDFDADGQDDFPITSGWGLGVLTTSGLDFGAIGLAAYDWLSLTSSVQLVGAGKFDRTGRQRLLFKMPPPTAQLTASPNTVSEGQESFLSWNSTNASSCTGTDFETNGAPQSPPGGVSTGPLYADPMTRSTLTYSFSVTCIGERGGSTTADASVSAIHPNAPGAGCFPLPLCPFRQNIGCPCLGPDGEWVFP